MFSTLRLRSRRSLPVLWWCVPVKPLSRLLPAAFPSFCGFLCPAPCSTVGLALPRSGAQTLLALLGFPFLAGLRWRSPMRWSYSQQRRRLAHSADGYGSCLMIKTLGRLHAAATTVSTWNRLLLAGKVRTSIHDLLEHLIVHLATR